MAGIASGWQLFWVVAVAASVVDLATKSAIFRILGMPAAQSGLVLLPNVLTLETNLNEGALFGMGQGMGLLFAAVSVAAFIGIVALMWRPAIRADRWMVLALALITGGIVGNLYDRLGFPGLVWHAPQERIGQPVLAVRDWIHFKLDGIIDWPIFNLADTWLVIGSAILVFLSFRPPLEDSPTA